VRDNVVCEGDENKSAIEPSKRPTVRESELVGPRFLQRQGKPRLELFEFVSFHLRQHRDDPVIVGWILRGDDSVGVPGDNAGHVPLINAVLNHFELAGVRDFRPDVHLFGDVVPHQRLLRQRVDVVAPSNNQAFAMREIVHEFGRREQGLDDAQVIGGVNQMDNPRRAAFVKPVLRQFRGQGGMRPEDDKLVDVLDRGSAQTELMPAMVRKLDAGL
jgi:hypothetical protein